ncbi:MAG TPA: hypothetical protein VGI19_10315 [Candidatus Cybelea sp.]
MRRRPSVDGYGARGAQRSERRDVGNDAERKSQAQNLIEDRRDLLGRKEPQQSLIHVGERKNFNLLAGFAQPLRVSKAQRINNQCCGAFRFGVTFALIGNLN